MIPKPYLSIVGLAIFLFSTMFAQSGETQAELEARLASIEKSEELLQKEIEGYSPPNNEQAHERNLARFETQAALFEKQKAEVQAKLNGYVRPDRKINAPTPDEQTKKFTDAHLQQFETVVENRLQDRASMNDQNPNPIYRKLDLNKDGRISPEEAKIAHNISHEAGQKAAEDRAKQLAKIEAQNKKGQQEAKSTNKAQDIKKAVAGKSTQQMQKEMAISTAKNKELQKELQEAKRLKNLKTETPDETDGVVPTP